VHNAVLPAVTPDKATDFFGLKTGAAASGAATAAVFAGAAFFAATFLLVAMLFLLGSFFYFDLFSANNLSSAPSKA
jgi:hypothetical protein